MMFAPLIALALVQEPAADPFKDIKLGDRVEITLRSDYSVRGKLVVPGIDDQGRPTVKADPSILLSSLTDVTLDISMEYPEMTGYMGFDKGEVASVRKLRELTAEEAQAIEKERQKMTALAEKENAARRARAARDEQERLKEIEEAIKRTKEREMEQIGSDLTERLAGIKKAAEIYKKFPPEQGWGPDAIKKIADKARLRLPVTPEEREFVDNLDLWNQYDQYLKGEKEKEKEKAMPPTPGSTSPSPSPSPSPSGS